MLYCNAVCFVFEFFVFLAGTKEKSSIFGTTKETKRRFFPITLTLSKNLQEGVRRKDKAGIAFSLLQGAMGH